MKLNLLLGLALVAPLLSGCLTDQIGPSTLDGQSGGISAGDTLPTIAFEATGRVLAPDPFRVTCTEVEQGCVVYDWNIPADSADGVPQRATSVVIELHPTSATSIDLDLFVRDANGNTLGSSINAEPGASEYIALGPMDPQTLVIEVQGFAGASMDFQVVGEATMVATQDAVNEVASGDVTVSRQGDQFVARRTLTFDRDVSADAGDAIASTGAGGISFIASGSKYHLTADLAGRGDTEQEARARLEEITLDHGFVDAARLTLDVHARPGNGGWNNKEATLRFEVPAGMEWGKVNLDTIAGAVAVRNMNIDSLHAGTTAGSVTATDLAVGDLELESTAGTITADLRAPLRSGIWQLDSTAGAVDLELVEGSNYGYDVDARTGAGSVRFHFSDADTTSSDCEYASCHKTAQTSGYETRAVKVIVDLDTSAGSISAGS